MLKRLIPLAAFAALLAIPASLVAQQNVGSVCKDGTTSNATGQGACSGHGGVDKAATDAAHKPPPKPKPAPPAPPPAPASSPNANVKCADGTMSHGGQGACSHHGGVAHNGTPAPAPAAPPNAPNAQVTCADGTKSNGGQGACSHHGGVAHNGAAPAPPPAPAPAPPPAPNSPNTTGGSGESVNNNPQGAIAKCKDGSYSHAKQHSGACSKHGGVAQWLDGTTKQ